MAESLNMTAKPSPSDQLQQILGSYANLRKNYGDDLGDGTKAIQVQVRTSLVAAIQRLAPTGTYYYTSLELALDHYGHLNRAIIPVLVGIVQALKTAYESGYLYEVEELIHAELFSDFLDMGQYLLKEGYKDPAAVIIGGVLEEHLRKLCLKNSINIKTKDRLKKADAMNADLANSNVYNRLDQKNITAWLDLRNKAAHGKYTEYTEDQVELTLQGIRDFIARFPA
ncbi:MAG: hypothetical protein WBH01_05990 [Dehalococcoidia bacterium]